MGGWGIDVMELDASAPPRGAVCVRRFVGVFPGGDLAAWRDAGAPLMRPLPDRAGGRDARLRVFLSRGVLAPATQGALSIAFEGEPMIAGDVIQIGEVYFDPAGRPTWNDDFVPAIRRLDASPWVVRQLAQVRAHCEQVRMALLALPTTRGADAPVARRVEALDEFLPVLDHLVTYGGTEPEHAYTWLCQFAGRLSALTAADERPQLPRFDRGDLASTFGGLVQAIARRCPTPSRRVVPIPLAAREDGLHFARFDDLRLPREAQYFVGVRAGLGDAQMLRDVPTLAKVASWSEITEFVQSPSPGVRVAPADRLPEELLARPRACWFALATQGPAWRSLHAEQTVALYLPPPYTPPTASVELVAVYVE